MMYAGSKLGIVNDGGFSKVKASSHVLKVYDTSTVGV